MASAIFGLAILHTFAAARFTALAHGVQHRHAERQRQLGRPEVPSVLAEALHFLGEVEVVFGLWAIVLLVAITGYAGWHTAAGYFNGTVNYTEPLFVIVIMALASTRPIILLAENALRVLARVGKGTPATWWAIILTVGPLLGSLITEPGAMTICALLLGRQFYDLQPSSRLKYATLGLLFVNVSIGGTLTHFAAPPVLMVARLWNWDTPFMLGHFGWRAVVAIVASVVVYGLIFRRELAELGARRAVPDVEVPEEDDASAGLVLLPVPAWITVVHVVFMAWTVFTSHYPALFLGGFLIFLGFVRATAPYQSRVELKAPLLVGFFLAGLVIHGGLQAWWIAPVLASLSETPLFATRDDPDGVQRQRADHLPVDARAQPERRHEDRGDGRRGDRRRPDGHRQRPEPGRAGDPGPLLRRRGVADLAAGRRAAADADGRDRVQDPAVMTFRDL